jgi:Cu-Zn family superoxide dismutase
MIALVLGVAALVQTQATPLARPRDEGPPAITEIRSPTGRLLARATLWQSRDGVEVRIQAAGLAAGRYGAHIHRVGRCTGLNFADAGPHWNPTGRQHGSLNPQGQHLGDLPNLEVDASGAGRIEFAITRASITGADGVIDADGAAVVIHATADDYRTDPSGNSGRPVACGVFAPPR